MSKKIGSAIAFVAVNLAQRRLVESLKTEAQRTAFIFSTEPLISLLELSGLAILYQELTGKPFWDIVSKIWDKFVTDKDVKSLATMIMNIVAERSSMFMLAPRALERTSWKQDFVEQLKKAGLLRDGYMHYDDFEDEYAKIESPILRAYVEHMLVDPRDVFSALYLVPKVDSTDKVPPHVESFIKGFERERGDGNHE